MHSVTLLFFFFLLFCFSFCVKCRFVLYGLGEGTDPRVLYTQPTKLLKLIALLGIILFCSTLVFMFLIVFFFFPDEKCCEINVAMAQQTVPVDSTHFCCSLAPSPIRSRSLLMNFQITLLLNWNSLKRLIFWFLFCQELDLSSGAPRNLFTGLTRCGQWACEGGKPTI